MNPLTSSGKKQLRGYAQRLKPAVRIGKHGLTSGVFQEIEKCFEAEELLKIRFDCSRDEMATWVDQVAGRTGSECVGSVGRTAAFYRQKPAPEFGP